MYNLDSSKLDGSPLIKFYGEPLKFIIKIKKIIKKYY
jgi:hypothetical protein